VFDVGFWELTLILLVGLIVLGPERLPKAARSVGFYLRKLRTFVITAQQQLESEIDAEALRRDIAESKQNIRGALSEIRQDVEHSIRGEAPQSGCETTTRQAPSADGKDNP